MATISVMIAENDADQIRIISGALNKHDDFDIISTVSTRESALKDLSKNPDVILLSPGVLKEHTLSRFIRAVQAKAHKTRVIYLLKSVLSDENLISDIKTGIRGYIRIADPPTIIAKAIRAVNKGEIWAERRILEKAISKPMLLPETLQINIPGLLPLTSREMEMLNLCSRGLRTERSPPGAASAKERSRPISTAFIESSK